jgi:NOL1/NOP2/fmu family ribosome biogenesis protein
MAEKDMELKNKKMALYEAQRMESELRSAQLGIQLEAIKKQRGQQQTTTALNQQQAAPQP